MKLRNKKTGEIVDWDGVHITNDNDGEMFYSIAELNEDWEDYTPKDPLIKDEDVRTMIRLWAKYYDADILRYLELNGIDGHYLKAGLHSIDIDVEGLKVGMFYTVEELCGDEE